MGFLSSRRGECLDCDPPGSGKCAACAGTGRRLGSLCTMCHGSGECPLCGGTGVPQDSFKDLIPDWLDRLFQRLRKRTES
jgi:hypothetical protein